MAWWAGVGWGSRIANVESRLTKKGDRDVSYKTKGANCQGGGPGCVFFGPVRRPVLGWDVEEREGVAVRDKMAYGLEGQGAHGNLLAERE